MTSAFSRGNPSAVLVKVARLGSGAGGWGRGRVSDVLGQRKALQPSGEWVGAPWMALTLSTQPPEAKAASGL